MAVERRGEGVRLSLVHVNTAPDPIRGSGKGVLPVTFDRRELAQILAVYGRKVGQGEWRDYAMDFLKERAVFSVFARVSERPLFTIEKNPKLRNKQGQFSVASQDGRILKRGHSLENVLRVLDPKLAVVS